MKDSLKIYIDTIFADAPDGFRTEELKEQMYRDICDKYDDLIKDGKTPAAAYNICVSGIGDVTPLIEDIKAECGDFGGVGTPRGDVSDTDVEKPLAYGIMNAIAVALYILCWIPLVFISELQLFGAASDAVGITVLMLFVTAATVLMLLKKYTLPAHQRERLVKEEEKEEKEADKNEKNPIAKIISSIIWCVTVALYFLISFTTGAWHITWIAFIIAIALDNVGSAIVDLIRGGK